MTLRLVLVSSLLVSLLLHETVSISLPSIFGTRVTKDDVKKETVKDDVPLDHTHSSPEKDDTPNPEKEPPKPAKPTRAPIIPGYPHPADHPLHPHNRPDHFLHPDNLPHLPSLPSLPTFELPHLPALPPLPHLPSLPHFTRETIHATKTVFVEVTDKVTVHPVCMTVYKVTPPCLPYNHGGWRDGEGGVQDRQGAEGPAIQATSAPLMISPTATAVAGDFFNLEPTRILGGEYINEASPAPSEPDDSSVDSIDLEEHTGAEARSTEEGDRNGRWVRLTPPIKVEDAVKVKEDQPRDDEPAPAENTGLSPLHMVQQLMQRSPVTHYKTKTLWVTKVEKVLDTRVTATLIAKNCIPTNSHIPYCAPNGGLLGPGWHGGHHGAGTYLEGLGGVFVSGGFTDKKDGQKPETEVQVEQNASLQNLVVEAPEVEEVEGLKQQSVKYNEEEEVVEETTEKEGTEDDKPQETNTDKIST